MPLTRSKFRCSTCVKYAKSVSPNRDLRFQLTTNGTRLTEAVVEKLIEIDMHLLVSLDGPEKNHNANRVLESGKGTHHQVLGNLLRIRQDHEAYYLTHVGFSVVLTPQHDVLATQQFFDSQERLFGPGILTVSLVNDRGTDYWSRNPVSLEWLRSLEDLRLRYFDSILRENATRSKFLDSYFQHPLLRLFKRDISPRQNKHMPLNGGCLPGTRRLFVDCDGHYHMCERIEPTLPIGDVERGIDLDAVSKVWNSYRQANEKQCIECWLNRLCSQCLACAQGGEYMFPDLEQRCAERRTWMSRTLVDYCEIMETNPFALKFMDDIVVR